MTKQIEIHYKRNHDGLYSYATCEKTESGYRVLYSYRTQGDVLTPGTLWTDQLLNAHKGVSEIKIMEV
jgi:hypothetical protein